VGDGVVSDACGADEIGAGPGTEGAELEGASSAADVRADEAVGAGAFANNAQNLYLLLFLPIEQSARVRANSSVQLIFSPFVVVIELFGFCSQ
jgi:hypothetical protein